MPTQLIGRICRFYTSHLWLCLGLLAALNMLIVFAGAHRHSFIPDEDAYEMLATSLAQHGTYALPVEAFHESANSPNTYYAPGWPFVLAVGYFVLHAETGFYLVAACFWGIMPILLHWLSRELQLPATAELALLLWCTTNPFFLFYHLHLMTEVLAIPLLTLTLIVGVKLLNSRTWKVAVLLGIVSAADHLTRTALLLPVIAIWCTYIWVEKRSIAAAARLVILFGLTHLLLIFPWLLRMDRVGGQATLATERKMGSNLYVYNYPGVSNPYHISPGESIQFPDGLEKLTPAQRDALLSKLAVQFIRSHPQLYLQNCARRLYYLLSPVPNFYEAGALRTAAMAAASVIYVLGPFVFAVIGVFRRRRTLNAAQGMLVLSIVFWYVFHVAVHASVRQRLPSDVTLAVLAASLVWGAQKLHAAPGTRTAASAPVQG